MKAQARLRAARAVADLPAIAPGGQRPRQGRRAIGADIERAGFDRLVAHLHPVAPAAVDRVPGILPALAQQFPAQALGRGALAVAVERDDVEARRLPLGDRVVAGRRAQPDRQRARADRPGQVSLIARPLGSKTLTRIVAASGFVRSGRSARSSVHARFAGVVGRRRVEVVGLAGEFLVGEAEMKAGLVRVRVVVEGDRRLGLDREPGAGRAVIVVRRHPDRERRTRPDRLVGGGQLDLELSAGRNPRPGTRRCRSPAPSDRASTRPARCRCARRAPAR